MGGAIKGVKEHVEEQVGMVLRTRNQIVVQLARRPGLGPPDLVWLSKTDRLAVEEVSARHKACEDEGAEAEQDARPDASENSDNSSLEPDDNDEDQAENSAGAEARHIPALEKEEEGEDEDFGEKFGSFHWVLGVHVSSPAQLAAYFARLAGAMEPPSALQSLWWLVNPHRPNRVDAGVYCSYDAFSRLDLRCEVTMPGSVHAYAVDGSGGRYDMDSVLWRGVLVSAWLRWMNVPLAAALKADCVSIHDMLPTPELEQQLLVCVLELYAEGVAGEMAHMLHTSTPGGRPYSRTAIDFLTASVLMHFQRKQRLAQAVEFLRAVKEYSPEVVCEMARALTALGLHQEALLELQHAARTTPASERIATTLAEMLVDLGGDHSTSALNTARDVVRRFPRSAEGYVLLARAYFAVEQYELAFATLNVCPPPPLEQLDATTAFFCNLGPRPRCQTQPSSVDIHADMVAEQACIVDNDLPGRASLINLGAPHLLPSHHAPSAAHNVFVWQRGQAYSILVQLVSVLGWDEFLALRSQLVVLDAEEEPDDSMDGTMSSPSQLTSEDEAASDADDEQDQHQASALRGAGETTLSNAGSRCEHIDSAVSPCTADEEAEVQSEPRVDQNGHKPRQNSHIGSSRGWMGSLLGGIFGRRAQSSSADSTPTAEPAHALTREDGKRDPCNTETLSASSPAVENNSELQGAATQDQTALGAVAIESPSPQSDRELDAAKGDVCAALDIGRCRRTEGGCEELDADDKDKNFEVTTSQIDTPDGANADSSSWDTSSESSAVWTVTDTDASNNTHHSEALDIALEEQQHGGGKRHWMDVKGIVLNARLPAKKRMCAVWLDELVQLLYDDMEQYMDWLTTDASARAMHHDSEGYNSDEEREHDRQAGHTCTAGDWLRRGELCLRLRCEDDAERALRVCVLEGSPISAWLLLAKLYAQWGWAYETLLAAGQIMDRPDMQPFTSRLGATSIPSPLCGYLHEMVAKTGLQSARDAQDRIGAAPLPIERFFHDVVKWKCEGWDQ